MTSYFSVWCDNYFVFTKADVIDDQSFWTKHNVSPQECRPFSLGLINGTGNTLCCESLETHQQSKSAVVCLVDLSDRIWTALVILLPGFVNKVNFRRDFEADVIFDHFGAAGAIFQCWCCYKSANPNSRQPLSSKKVCSHGWTIYGGTCR